MCVREREREGDVLFVCSFVFWQDKKGADDGLVGLL